MLKSNKKLTILCMLEILRKYSDESHPLTQAEIVKKLNAIYGVECERKSVGMSLDSLIDFGLDIVKLEKGGCYLGAREFESSEIAFLVDAVFASKNISSKHAKDLALKLSDLRSVYEQKHFRYLYKADEISRTVNKSLFLNIDIINEAIDKGRKVEFKYNFYVSDKILKARRDKFYIINPYFMLNNNGKYYLVCNREGFSEVSNYKLDYMTDIRLSDEPVKPVTELPGYEKGLDIARYANENVYMFGDKAFGITLKLADDWAVSNVLDWFGKNARIYSKQTGEKTEIFADITASERAVIYWSLQYGQAVEIISPEKTREKISDMAEQIAGKYRT